MKNKPHKHAKFIKAWALGHEIERLINDDWISAGSKTNSPRWYSDRKYRIKPIPKMVEVKMYHWVVRDEDGWYHETSEYFKDEKHWHEYYHGGTCTMIGKLDNTVILVEEEVK
jgi:hypothetical protein